MGEDGLPIRLIKIGLPYILSAITHLINHIFTTSTYPQLWKIGQIIPVPKQNKANEPADFRPITILPCLSKVGEMLMAEQIREHFESKKLLSPLQSGFRPGHSCSTSVMKIMDDIRSEFDQNFLILLILLDFSKAFDKVDLKMLVEKLGRYFGFSNFALKLLLSYLSNRMQRVKVEDRFSSYAKVNSGVPQGSVLGPLLFTAFINDIFSVVKHSNIHAYADDIQIYMGRRVGLIEDLCCRLNEDLQSIHDWAISNRLTLNSLKSCVLPISKQKIDSSSIPPILLDSTQLKLVEKVRNLGYVVNTSLSCADHVNSLVSKIYFTLRNLRMTSEFTPTETKQHLVKQLIMPLINYSATVYSKLDSASLHKLQVAFNSATRYVYNIRKYDHLNSWKNKILGCSLESYLDIRNCIFLHKLILSKTPPYLFEKLRFSLSSRNNDLIIPKFYYQNSERCFFVNAARKWNSIPTSIREECESSKFKALISEHFS